MPIERIDPEFRALPLAALADAALSRARELGAAARRPAGRADRQPVDRPARRRGRHRCRRLHHGRAGRAGDRRRGLGVRLARRAHPGAGGRDGRAGGGGGPHAGPGGLGAGRAGRRAGARATRSGSPTTPSTRSPCPTRDKVGLLTDWSQRLLAADGVDHVQAGVAQVRENKFYADLAGTSTTQQRVRIAPSFTATAVDRAGGGFETMDSLAPPAGRGWEYLTGARLGLRRRAGRAARAAGREGEGALGRRRPLRPGHRPDEPVADHPRVGRARHRVRPGHRLRGRVRRHQLRHPRPARHAALRLARSCTSPATAPVPHGLATIGFDDDGVATTAWDLVRDGVLVGYQLDRTFAPAAGAGPQQRLRVRRLPAPRADPADGQRVAAAATPRATPAPRS